MFDLARNVSRRHQLDAQGGWTALSSEGRYSRAPAAYGDMDRSTNTFYRQLLKHLRSSGRTATCTISTGRLRGHWPWRMLRQPYTQDLTEILGPPIAPEEMWNPDAVLRVEDIHHRPNTAGKGSPDKAAATQMVFEDGTHPPH